jgi:integrase/recombinase XerD
MLTIYRRHRSSCKKRGRRAKGCSCPIWVQGVLGGVPVRRSLDLTSWEAANRKVHDLEVHGEQSNVSVKEGAERWIADSEARHLKPPSIRKYKEIKRELVAVFGSASLRSVSVDDLRKLREGWKLSGTTTRKRLELVRGFFSFCVASGWVQTNPAKTIRPPAHKPVPTLPYSDDEWKKIVWALDAYKEIHRQSPMPIIQKLRALVFLMRYSGLRISDAVQLTRDRVDGEGNLFLYQAKTNQPVSLPVPRIVLDSLAICDEGGRYYFWSGAGKLKTALTDWQERLKKVFTIAGIENGHGHRLRDTFAVSLLAKGVSLETVSTLLGHTSIATTEKHYAPWVKSRQDALEDAVKKTWV